MTRIGIDATPVLVNRKGLGVFFEGLLDEWVRTGQMDGATVYVDGSVLREASSRWPSFEVCGVQSTPALAWERWRLPRRVKKDGVGMLFTGRDGTCLEPYVSTLVYLFEVPDYRVRMTLEGECSLYARASTMHLRFRFKDVVKRVSRWIASSEATRHDLVGGYGVPEEKTRVAYPGLLEMFFQEPTDQERSEARQALTDGRRYVLHFATGDKRENTGTALETFREVVQRIPGDLALLLAGADSSGRAISNVSPSDLDGRVYRTGFLSRQELRRAYVGASVYLDPSLYEGFGFQPAEAMACGVPVVTSNVTSLPEVVGDGGLTAAPCDTKALCSAVLSILENEATRNALTSRGRVLAARFRWERAAGEIAAAICEAREA